MDHSGDFDATTVYLNTASMGLPPHTTRAALTSALQEWAAGRAEPEDYDAAVRTARTVFAQMVHVDAGQVAIGHQVAPLIGLIAAAVPDGAEVLVPEGEFTSVTFPFAAHHERGVRVRQAPLADLAAHVGADTAVVAVAAVQSATGAIADLDRLEETCARYGADLVVDLTQATGWFDVRAGRFAATVCGAYKWLLSPRGSAFLTVRPELAERLRPLAANWFAGEDVWESIYGLPLRLAADARRFDVSPAWHSWVGTAASLEYLRGIGPAALQEHALGLAHVFEEAADLPPGGSAIISVRADHTVPGVLADLGVVAAQRAGRLRLSFHVHNTAEQAHRVGRALRGRISR